MTATPHGRNQVSEYLPQSRKGRKENIFSNLACVAPWREVFRLLVRAQPRSELRVSVVNIPSENPKQNYLKF
jgi:hypothetical protein